MMQVGHIQIGTDGRMRRVDDQICGMLSYAADAMVGRSMLDFTYPADRDACRRCMQELCRTHQPFAVVKRMVHADGSPLWVTKTVAMASFGDGDASIMATITRATDPGDAGTPPELLRQARLLVADIRERREWLDSAIFVDPPSSILLGIYVAEAEGRLADIDAMAEHAGVARGVLVRWMRAMADEGLLEEEGQASGDPSGYRLTQPALERCERYLMYRVRVQGSTLAAR